MRHGQPHRASREEGVREREHGLAHQESEIALSLFSTFPTPEKGIFRTL
jgi:hypothetical protein